ncbi:unnamed protein product [Peronospora farinosa]|uniref:Retrovirus-related Pol polyprotein from transposon TNT 1-94-like beta-barrel domain-containing protein n=1 Tax=Peronospora farinosa TaxID=134698 RepID=A0AAV0UEF6_9STRA|nr:unnamed protein product [Peronospora farinosa]
MLLDVNDSQAGASFNWILDSGASRHIASDDRLIIESKQYNDEIYLADNKMLVLTKAGRVRLFVTSRGEQRQIELSDVYYAPSLAHNLISYGNFEHLGYPLTYTEDGRESAIKTADVILSALEEEATADVSPDVQESTLVKFQ